MAKRFTDSGKWAKPWYRKLPPKYKLLWLYLVDNCDHAGIWSVDLDLASYQIGIEYDIAECIGVFAGRVRSFDDGDKWFIEDYVSFQYNGELNESNRVHASVIKTLKRYGLYRSVELLSEKESENKGLTSPLQGAKDKYKYKDKDKDKDTEEGGMGGETRSLSVVFKPPTIEDVQTMFRIRGLPDSEAELFHSYYDSQGWVKANGQPVRNWQQLIPSWITKYHKDKHNEQKHKRANGDRTHEPLTAEGLSEYRERTRAALTAAVETFQRDRTNEVDGRTNGEAPSVPALRIRRGDKWVDPNAIDT